MILPFRICPALIFIFHSHPFDKIEQRIYFNRIKNAIYFKMMLNYFFRHPALR